MCGVTGVVSLSGKSIDTNKVKPMCDVIAHRGPDGAGYLLAQSGVEHPRGQQYFESFTDKEFAADLGMVPCIDDTYSEGYINKHQWDIFLGHRRLAVLDLSVSGFQPISDIGKNVWVTYNGEIYNFREIRKELEKLGYEFYSNTDSEVLVNAYIEWGIECVNLFNGMFAFALWDKHRNKLFLVRDRYGIKPLYYTKSSKNELVFASETKSILTYLEDSPKLNHEALIEYFTFQNFFSNNTLHKDINLLPAGHYIEIELNNKKRIVLKQYWDFNFHDIELNCSEEEYREELDRLFSNAVNRQMVSDVELGCYLSGGMDSGSITAIAANSNPYMKTFTCGFDLNSASGLELAFDERSKAEYMSYFFKTEHYEMVLKSGDMERCLSKLAYHIEEPRVGQSYPNYYAAQLASKFVKVVMSGAGGDELFAGYPWRYYRAAVNDNFDDYIAKYYQFWQRLVSNRDITKLFAPIWHEVEGNNSQELFRGVFNHQPNRLYSAEDYINHSLYFEAKTFLHGLLVVEDKLSMAHSLETRVPFLDNDLVDFAMKCPVRLKLNNLSDVIRVNENDPRDKQQVYFNKTKDGKQILRDVMKRHIPDEITNAVKQGFSAPDASWFQGDSIEFVKRKLLSNNARVLDYMDKNMLNSLVNEHLSGKSNKRLLIWSLLSFEMWCEHYGC